MLKGVNEKVVLGTASSFTPFFIVTIIKMLFTFIFT